MIETAHSLKTYFHEKLHAEADIRNISHSTVTIRYLSDMLYNFRRTDNLFDSNKEGRQLTPLAEYYRLSIESENTYEQRMLLRKLGDVSLVVSALYKGSLRRKPVDISYYVSMGERAYRSLATIASSRTKKDAFSPAYNDLAQQFEDFSKVIATLDIRNSKRDGIEDTTDNLLEKFSRWEETKNPEILNELNAAGIFPSVDSVSDGFVLH